MRLILISLLVDIRIIFKYRKAFYQGGLRMPVTAKIFISGRSQAVRLPKEFRFKGKEVFIRRDAISGDVILSHHPDSWAGLFELGKTRLSEGPYRPSS